MKGYMFQSRAGALAFVGITLFGVATLVGTEDEDGALADATAQIEQQRAELLRQSAATNRSDPESTGRNVKPMEVQEEPIEVEFTPDEELVVDPTGIDPSPIIPDPIAREIISVEPAAEE